jgi:hypothetical protein
MLRIRLMHPALRRAAFLAGAALAGAAAAAADSAPASATAPATATAPAAGTATPAPRVSPYQPDRFAGRAGRYYATAWGIDTISVKLVESGELIRFSYRVIDPAHAAPLNDKRLKPSLIDISRGVSLVVPEMENVGMLRQTAVPQENRVYWIAFSNKGRFVKRGDRVDVVIGPFHATNLVVD